MTEEELLIKVKTGLGITHSFQDETIRLYIEDVKAFMISAGVSQMIVNSEFSVGCILRGVADLYNFGSGNTKFSPYFLQRVQQLKKE